MKAALLICYCCSCCCRHLTPLLLLLLSHSKSCGGSKTRRRRRRWNEPANSVITRSRRATWEVLRRAETVGDTVNMHNNSSVTGWSIAKAQSLLPCYVGLNWWRRFLDKYFLFFSPFSSQHVQHVYAVNRLFGWLACSHFIVSAFISFVS